jgi:sulfide:quinone oxidoreductase
MCSPQGATGSKDTKPIACEVLGHLLEEKKIRVVHDFAIASVDSEKHRIVSWDEKEVGYE